MSSVPLGNKDTSETVEVRTSKDFRKLDTHFVYNELQVNEEKGLIKDISKIGNFHFKKLVFISPKRKNFPAFKVQVRELRKCEFITPVLNDLPGFIPNDSLHELLIESDKFRVDSCLLRFESLRFLGLFCSSKQIERTILCQMTKLEELAVSSTEAVNFDPVDCLFNLRKLKTLSLNLDEKSIKLLTNFENLEKIYFQNSLPYSTLENNLTTLKRYDRVSIVLSGLTEGEIKVLKKQLKIW